MKNEEFSYFFEMPQGEFAYFKIKSYLCPQKKH